MKPEIYDILVLGSGEAGKYIAWTLAKQGRRVAVIEREYVGGSCPNIACLPSKNMIHGAKVASYFSRSSEFGISKDNCRIDMAAVRDRKRKMVAGLVDVHLANFKSSGAELLIGAGRFTGPKTIELTQPDGAKRLLQGGKIVISVGTHATIDPIPGLAEAGPLTHVEALELDHIPAHLLVLGGGYIGLEFAQAMRRFGSRVTVIERNAKLIHREDDDVTDAVHELFRDEGIEVLTNAQITKVEGKSGEMVTVHVMQAGKQIMLTGSHLLAASGRTPNTKGIGLELAGVALTGRAYIQVNERLETTAPDVVAVGECAGSPHFTHIAFDDFRIVRDNLAGGNRVTTGRQVPFCLFTDPELARIGLGVNIALHGWTRIPEFSAFAGHLHTQFAATFLPAPLVQLSAYGIVTAESVVGTLLLLGLWLRGTLVLGGGLMIVLMFGTCLVQNWSVAGSQLVYLAFFAGLLATRRHDWLSLDAMRVRRE